MARLGSTSEGGMRKVSAIFLTKAPVTIFAALAVSVLLPASEILDASEAPAAPSLFRKSCDELGTANGPNRASLNQGGLGKL
ncbi:hypothetical protein N7497_009295 [Penicillium chrysogenum]|jgi:hypothetical protein|uniref:Uncharacterized protein n=1 Tax=Penicillium chrysogenum TaxID=5076 RepID=A0ABQ8WJ42_PENCH|nr:hypothetical protein N7505_005711 [Penicillium chrysogenum]KAJ6147313.1 hypothetical protein N7497_009295 [Penicillium chrysogenum]